MIAIFHFLMYYVLKTIKKKLQKKFRDADPYDITSINEGFHPLCEITANNDIKFDPPLYKQRYERALGVLTNKKWKHHIKKLVDFGCAEFGFFVFLKYNSEFRRLTFVDVDELLLNDCLYRVQPLNFDYINRRKNKLGVKVYGGSIADPDPCLLDADAVVGLEIVEHLYPDVLEAIPYNLFSVVRPKLVIFTTPNADFNVLLKNLVKFRHVDHKFEWTREQFQSWALNITERFPSYVVRFDGIGLGPIGTWDLGCCSQLAAFIRKDICDNISNDFPKSTCAFSASDLKSHGICTYNSLSNLSFVPDDQSNYYKLIANVEYPIDDDNRTDEEKNIDELKYCLNNLCHLEEFYNYDKHCSEVPLSIICKGKIQSVMSEADVRNVLIKLNYQINECRNLRTNSVEDCVIVLSAMNSNNGSDIETDASGYESDSNKYAVENEHGSDWDEPCANEWTFETDVQNEFTVPRKEVPKAALHLDVNVTPKQQEALVDSGYQKSPQTFEDSSPNESSPIAHKPHKLSNFLSVFNTFDRVNELDSLGRDKRFQHSYNLPHKEMMKKVCQEIAKTPLAGPSHESRCGKSKQNQSSDSDESSEEVKSITTCIVENSLNRIDIEDEPRQCDIIQDVIHEEVAADEQVVVLEAPLIVENGDLANNNRDREGNNYVAPEVHNDVMDIDNIIVDNNNDVDQIELAEALEVEDILEDEIVIEPLIDLEVDWSSREALFDINSQVDLLEDYEMGGPPIEGPSNAESSLAESCLTNVDQCNSCATLPSNEESFPDWLLNLSDGNDELLTDAELYGESHYFCQGDGLGVHASRNGLNDDESDGNNSSDSGQESSSSGSADFELAEAESRLLQDHLLSESLVLEGQAVVSASSDGEVFENAESL